MDDPSSKVKPSSHRAGLRLSELGNNFQPRRLRYYSVFVVVLIALFMAEVRLTLLATERLILPLVHPSPERLGFINNTGALSNGEQLEGWQYRAIVLAEVSFCIPLGVGSSIAIAYCWPKRRNNRMI